MMRTTENGNSILVGQRLILVTKRSQTMRTLKMVILSSSAVNCSVFILILVTKR